MIQLGWMITIKIRTGMKTVRSSSLSSSARSRSKPIFRSRGTSLQESHRTFQRSTITRRLTTEKHNEPNISTTIHKVSAIQTNRELCKPAFQKDLGEIQKVGEKITELQKQGVEIQEETINLYFRTLLELGVTRELPLTTIHKIFKQLQELHNNNYNKNINHFNTVMEFSLMLRDYPLIKSTVNEMSQYHLTPNDSTFQLMTQTCKLLKTQSPKGLVSHVQSAVSSYKKTKHKLDHELKLAHLKFEVGKMQKLSRESQTADAKLITFFKNLLSKFDSFIELASPPPKTEPSGTQSKTDTAPQKEPIAPTPPPQETVSAPASSV